MGCLKPEEFFDFMYPAQWCFPCWQLG